MEIYEYLKNDHEEVKVMLEELINLADKDDYRFVLIKEIEQALVPHSRAEESVFYNTLRAVNADKRIVFHGFQEHAEAETLLRALQVLDRLDMSWKGTAKKLQEAVTHHIEEEESTIFAEAQAAFTSEEALAMGEAFEQLKEKVKGENKIQTTVDMFINLMPPRLADKIRDIGGSSAKV